MKTNSLSHKKINGYELSVWNVCIYFNFIDEKLATDRLKF